MLHAERIIHTTCPYCGVGCQIDLHVRDNVIFRVSGRTDNKVNYGNLCSKGRFGYDYVHAPDRLTQPLLGKAEGRRQKAEGSAFSSQSSSRSVPSPREDSGQASAAFIPASWDKALDVVAGRLRQIRDQYGPDSVAILTSAKCTNEENYLLQKFARAVIGTNNVDHCARL